MITVRQPFLRRHRARIVPSYPPGVIAAGLRTLWDKKGTAGLKTTPTKTMPADAASLPAGAAWGNSGGDNFVVFNSSCDIADWDFTGFKVQADLGAVATVRRSRLTWPGGGRLVETTASSTLNLVSCDVNATGILTTFHGMGIVNVGCTVTLDDCRLWGASISYFSVSGAFSSTNGTYFQCFGLTADPGDHGEANQWFQGSRVMSDTIMDMNDGGVNLAALTGLEFWNGQNDNLVVTLNNSILNFPSSWGLPYACQTGTGTGFTTNITVTGCAIKKGVTTYIQPNANVTVTTGAGNYDLETGALISDLTAP